MSTSLFIGYFDEDKLFTDSTEQQLICYLEDRMVYIYFVFDSNCYIIKRIAILYDNSTNPNKYALFNCSFVAKTDDEAKNMAKIYANEFIQNL